MDMIGFFVGMSLALVFFAIVLLVASYVVGAMFTMAVGKDVGLEKHWMAWVPICNIFYLGDIAEVGFYKEGFKTKLIGSAAVMLVSSFLSGLLADTSLAFVFSIIYLVAAIAYLVFYYQLLYWIYQKYVPSYATLALVLSILFTSAAFVMQIIVLTKTGERNKM